METPDNFQGPDLEARAVRFVRRNVKPFAFGYFVILGAIVATIISGLGL